MPALPLTATQQAPLQSLFASSPFDAIRDKQPSTPLPPRANSLTSTPPSTPPLSSTSTAASHHTLQHRRHSTAAVYAQPSPPPLATLCFTTVGQCQSITVPNTSSTDAMHLHVSAVERAALRAAGFRLPDVKSSLVVPPRSERPLVIVWDGRASRAEDDKAARTVVHELHMEHTNSALPAILVRLSATWPLSPSAGPRTPPTSASTEPSAGRRPSLRKLTQWLFASSMDDKAGRHSADSTTADSLTVPHNPRTTRRHSASAITASHAATLSVASTTASISSSSPTDCDEWSSPRHASEPPVLSPLGHMHCYTLAAADVYTHGAAMGGSGGGSPWTTGRTLSIERPHSRSFSFPTPPSPVPRQ